ncbi:MAG: hypothetical protein LBU99_01615 [Spirochaetaceae bacterium]|jgi:hypothetical protein|nr:hypothetical protein [Spirochaetaceae bacterium]
MKQNTLRGKLLDFLKYLYPEGAEINEVITVFFQYHKVADIEEALEYLSDKGYILKKEVPHPYRAKESIRWYKILPKGIDLINGDIADEPGISIIRR